MNFNRKQELVLIGLGLHAMLDKMVKESQPKKCKVNKVKKIRKQKWSKAQHAKFARTMARKWKARNGHE